MRFMHTMLTNPPRPQAQRPRPQRQTTQQHAQLRLQAQPRSQEKSRRKPLAGLRRLRPRAEGSGT